MTDGFCVRASDVCAHIRGLNSYGYITYDFSAIDMIIKTKPAFFGRVFEIGAVKAQPYSGKGGGE